jgi:hypothetical protein
MAHVVLGAAILLALTAARPGYAQLPVPTAAPTISNDRSMTTPDAFPATNQCTGESVVVNGTTHTTTQTQSSSDGNTRTRTVTHNFGNGVSTVSSRRYEYSAFDEMTQVTKTSERPPSYITFDNTAHFILQGESPGQACPQPGDIQGCGDDWFSYSKVTINTATFQISKSQTRDECR